MYSTKHLQYLIALKDTGSFSEAATQCHVTQSTLSLGIKELERQMGVQLFERSRKNIIPTPAGVNVLIHAKNIIHQQKQLVNDIQSMTDPKSVPLRLGAIPTIAPYFLPVFLPLLDNQLPQSHIQIAEDTTETILEKIRKGEMDLGILAFPIDVQDLEYKILFEENFVIATHKSSSLNDNIKIENLSNEDLLLLRDGHCLKDHILSACKLQKSQQNQFFEADSLQTLLAMVNQGYGATLLPDMAITANITASYPNVRLIKFSGKTPQRKIGLVWRRTDVRRREYLSIDF